MLTTSFTKKGKKLVCNFHHSEHRFQDFKSFFTFACDLARKKKVRILEVIHGKGRDPNGLPYLGDLIVEKASKLDSIVRLERDAFNSGVLRIHLSKDLPAQPRDGVDFKKGLTGLLRELKADEDKTQVKYTPKAPAEGPQTPPPDFILDLFRRLETEWDEKVVIDVLDTCRLQKSYALTRLVLDHIAVFRVFYSSEFEQYLRNR